MTTVRDHVRTLGRKVPVGTVLPFAGTTAPPGWLLCDNTAYNQTAFASLFEVLGGMNSPYGVGSGVFNVPDLRGRMVMGTSKLGSSECIRTCGYSLGSFCPARRGCVAGAESATVSGLAHGHSKGNFQGCSQGAYAVFQIAGQHSHYYGVAQDVGSTSGSCARLQNGGGSIGCELATGPAGEHSHGGIASHPTCAAPMSGLIGNTGSGVDASSSMSVTVASIVQPGVVMNYIIKY